MCIRDSYISASGAKSSHYAKEFNGIVFCLNYSVVCFLLSKRYAFEVVQRSGCLSDPGGYVLGRLGRHLAVHVGGRGGVRQFTYTIAVHADRENNKNQLAKQT